MKKFNEVKAIDEENEEELNDENKEEPQNEFFTKDQEQEPNERRKIIRSEKLKMEKERNKTFINLNRIFEAIGWNKERQDNQSSINEINEEKNNSSSSSNDESDKKQQSELEIFSDDDNIFMEKNYLKKKNYFDDDSIIFKDTYSFKKTYINILKQIRGEKFFLPKNIKNKLLFNLEINIGDYIVSEGLIFNYVNYELEGKRKKKIFTLYRRYSEFAVYRKLLRCNWPGVFIPFLPPKKSYDNLDDTFILMRKKFLQYFCYKICNSPHLASSFETKIFLEPKNENFLELPIEIYMKNIEDINNTYNEFFGFLKEKDLSENEIFSVQNFFVMLLKSKKNLESAVSLVAEAKNTQMIAQKNLVNFYEYNYNVEDSLYNMFGYDQEKKEKLCEKTIEINTTENISQIKHENFFTTCFDFITSISDSVQGMIECISSLYELKDKFMSKFKELKEKNENLKSFVNRSFITKFFFPTNLNQVQQLINDIEDLKVELNTYRTLVDLVYKIIYFIEIPTFKKDQYEYYINFLNKINEEESHVQRKNKIIYNLFKEKCDKIMRIIYEESGK